MEGIVSDQLAPLFWDSGQRVHHDESTLWSKIAHLMAGRKFSKDQEMSRFP